MPQKDYKCNCNKCNREEWIAHESPCKCTCGNETQQCEKI